MAFEELEAQIAALLSSLEDNPKDPQELYELIRERLMQMRAMGLPLPQDLVDLEARLEAEFGASIAEPGAND
jgi:hypothetical protein